MYKPASILAFGLIFLPKLASAETCLHAGQLAGVIFGSIFGTLVICVGFSFVLWYLVHKQEKADKKRIFEKAHETEETITASEASDDHQPYVFRPSTRDQETLATIPTPYPRPSLDAARRLQRSLSADNILSPDDQRHLTLSRFGFSINRDDTDGIFIEEVYPETPAQMSGTIFAGDRIKTLTISFDNMSYEAALDILARVTDFTIRLDLERLEVNDGQTQTEGEMRLQKSWSSQSIRVPAPRLESLNSSSQESLEAPQPRDQCNNIPLKSCKTSFFEERSIRIVCHPPKKIRLPVVAEVINEEVVSSAQTMPPGHELIRAKEFEMIVKEKLECKKDSGIPMSSGSSQTCEEEECEEESTSSSDGEKVTEKSVTFLNSAVENQQEGTQDDEVPVKVRMRIRENDDAAAMYQKVRNSLREVYTAELEDKKAPLTAEQCNTLESNRLKLERETEQLRQLGLL